MFVLTVLLGEIVLYLFRLFTKPFHYYIIMAIIGRETTML